MLVQKKLSIQTPGRGLHSITEQVSSLIRASGKANGLCHIFLQHTSASLTICENADPSVMIDVENYFQRLIPDGDPLFTHVAEGVDDMSAHIRAMLTQTFLTLPFSQGQLSLGQWQGIYLWEHRFNPHSRQLILTLMFT